MTTEKLLVLCCDAIELVLAPASGGSIARFDYLYGDRRLPVLRGCEGVPRDALDAACFPLVPFCNRVRGGRFHFRGREVSLEPNMAGDPSPLHGQGWLTRWEVAAAEETFAELACRHSEGEWPWAYEARQVFRLDGGGLLLDLSCRNLSDEPMPCGLGQHPYFPCTPTTWIETGVTYVWTIDEHVLPVEKLPAEGRFDLAGRPACGQALDHGFGGWNGLARIIDPALPFAIAMRSPDAAFFQLYSPPEGGLFAAEPVSHANAALNEPEESWPDLGLRVLEPGETMALSMRIEVSPSSAPASPAS